MARRKAQPKPRRRNPKSTRKGAPEIAETPVDEITVRKKFALNLMNRATPTWLVVEAMCEHFEGLTKKQAEYAYTLVMNDMRDSVAKDAKAEAAMQISRLKQNIMGLMMNQPDVKNHSAIASYASAIARYELLLARVTGTLKPVRVDLGADHTIHDALSAIIGNESADDFEKRIARQGARQNALVAAGVEMDNDGNIVH